MVYVEWVDAANVGSGWTDRQKAIEEAKGYLEPITLAGFLIDETPEYIVVAVGYNDHADDVVETMIVPRRAVQHMEIVKRGSGTDWSLQPGATGIDDGIDGGTVARETVATRQAGC